MKYNCNDLEQLKIWQSSSLMCWWRSLLALKTFPHGVQQRFIFAMICLRWSDLVFNNVEVWNCDVKVFLSTTGKWKPATVIFSGLTKTIFVNIGYTYYIITYVFTMARAWFLCKYRLKCTNSNVFPFGACSIIWQPPRCLQDSHSVCIHSKQRVDREVNCRNSYSASFMALLSFNFIPIYHLLRTYLAS